MTKTYFYRISVLLIISTVLLTFTGCTSSFPGSSPDFTDNSDYFPDSGTSDITPFPTPGTVSTPPTPTPTSTPTPAPKPVTESLASTQITGEGAIVPDPVAYFGKNLTLTWASSTFNLWTFEGTFASYEAIREYVTLLDTSFDFDMLISPYEDIYQSGNYKLVDFEYIMSYNGIYSIGDEQAEGEHTKYDGDMVITGTYKVTQANPQGELECDIMFNMDITVLDEGYRFNEEKLARYYCGESFGAGLYKNTDGSYETSDGRFRVSVGEAVMLSDGVASRLTVLFNLNSRSNIQEFVLNNSMGITQAAFAFPITKTLTQGSIYCENQLLSEHGLANPLKNLTEKTVDLRYEGFRILHQERYYIVQQGMLADFNRLNMRIMYIDENYSVAVIYFCAEFDSKPNTVECLMAVPLNSPSGGTSAGNSDGVYNIKINETVEIKGPHEFDSKYHTYEWSFVSGSEFCEMHNTHAQTSKIIAHSAGTVRVRLVYSYTKKFVNVLGEYDHHAQTRTLEYVIYITQ